MLTNSIKKSSSQSTMLLLSLSDGQQQYFNLIDSLYQQQSMQKSQSAEQGDDKINSITIAAQIINCKSEHISRWLLEFKGIKNQNYQKFSKRIQENLAKNQLNFIQSRESFIDISNTANGENTTGHQMMAVLEGFLQYWRKCQLQFKAVQQLFNFVERVYSPISRKFIAGCRSLIAKLPQEDLKQFQDMAFQLANKYYRGTKIQEDKVLPLVYQFDLIEDFGEVKVIEIATRIQNINDVSYIFKTRGDQTIRKELVNKFIYYCVQRGSKQDLGRCQTLIKVLSLDYNDYDALIGKMIDRFLQYQLRTFKLYFVQLVLKHDINLIKALTNQLMKQRRIRQAKYFVVKYKLDLKNKIHIDEREYQQISNIRNILEDKDYFGPTQSTVLAEGNINYLRLQQLNWGQKDITFIDSSNIQEINCQQIFSNRSIGIDSESTGGTHTFDQQKTTILQIFTGVNFYVFDYFGLKNHPTFHKILVYILSNCKIYGHDHQKELTSLRKQLQLNVTEAVMQELQKNRIIDTNKLFKKIFPKETKSNLTYITLKLLERDVSKFQQCSGWRNRPLRKAQIHYACLDALLPYILGKRLQELQSKQKKK